MRILHDEISEEISDPRGTSHRPSLVFHLLDRPAKRVNAERDLKPQRSTQEVIALSIISDASVDGVVLCPRARERSLGLSDRNRTDARCPLDVLGCCQASTSSAQYSANLCP